MYWQMWPHGGSITLNAAIYSIELLLLPSLKGYELIQWHYSLLFQRIYYDSRDFATFHNNEQP